VLGWVGDGSRLEHYDLLARSAFVRAVMANRRAIELRLVCTPGNCSNPMDKAR
jgi:hypothetical protein